jgi:hypothetical protein
MFTVESSIIFQWNPFRSSEVRVDGQLVRIDGKIYDVPIMSSMYTLCVKNPKTTSGRKIINPSVSFVVHIELCPVKVKVILRLTVGQSVSLGIEPHLGPMTRYLLLV